jgi:MFS family permease
VLRGHFGDRLGRQGMLITSLVLMGLSTVGVGLLPGYDSIGLWAPVLLLVPRLPQGLSAPAASGAARRRWRWSTPRRAGAAGTAPSPRAGCRPG